MSLLPQTLGFFCQNKRNGSWPQRVGRRVLPPRCWGHPCLLMVPVSWPVPPTVLLDEIEAAEMEGNDDRIEGVLCGAVKQLKGSRAKPDGALYLSLMYLAKIKPNIFATEGVIEVSAAVPSVLHSFCWRPAAAVLLCSRFLVP